MPKIRCPVCNGEGVVDILEVQEYDDSNLKIDLTKETCPACHGTCEVWIEDKKKE